MRHRIEALGFWLVQALLSRLPLETASNCCGWVWRRIGPKLHRQRRADAHLQMALPHLTQGERLQITSEMWETLGRVFAEGFHLPELEASDRVELEDEAFWRPLFEEAKLKGQGWIFCGAHQGNW